MTKVIIHLTVAERDKLQAFLQTATDPELKALWQRLEEHKDVYEVNFDPSVFDKYRTDFTE